MAGGQPQYAQHYKSCHHDTRNKIGSRLVTIKKSPFKGFFQKMGNKLSCSCGPLKIKGYRFDDPWAANPRTRRDGHLLRLWAEVFHVTTSGSGTVKWQQVSEDLVPVNIACVADDPQLVFHITAYNSQVDKILDVRLVQPGTRIGQASECFVYWKDPATSDTWGLNFTSPIDAKQFRECCDGSRSNSSSRMRAKAASSRSTPASPSRSREPQCTCSHPDTLGGKPRQPHPEHRMRAATSCGMASGMNGQAIGNGNGSNTLNSVKRKPMSTPSSPTRDRKVQCTCMTPEQFAHLHRYQYSSTSRPDLRSGTLSRNQAGSREDLQSGESRDSRVSTAANSQASSVYDNVKESQRRQEGFGSVRDRPDRRNIRGSQRDIQDSGGGSRSSHGRPRHGASTGSLKLKKDLLSKSVDYSDMDTVREGEKGVTRKQRSKSIDHLNQSQDKNCRFDSRTLKKLLTPVGAVGSDSPLTSPETGRRASGRRVGSYDSDRDGGFMSEPEIVGRGSNRGRRGRGAHFDRDIGRPSTGNNAAYRKKAKEKLFLDFQDGDGEGEGEGANSPSSDVAGMFENQCYATTPSSSNGGESDFERDDGPDSPTSRLLMEYEEHLRNTLEKGMDAESYSLHTFEALLTQSMENLESEMKSLGMLPHSPLKTRKSDKDRAQTLPGRTGLGPGQQRPMIGRPMSVNSSFDSHTSHNHNPHPRDTSFARDSSFDSRRSGPDTGYYSDRNEAARNGYRDERGYLSDHSSRGLAPNYRQDSIRSGYISDHESRSGYERGGLPAAGTISRSSDGVHQQASIESMQSSDSRLCYLTSSEISDDDRMSLTTAVSEDDDAESVHNSPYKAKQSGSAASFNCTGAVRKAGFLSVKKWLLRKKHQVELARKRGWKGYWVCLKGTTLLFYPCDSREGRSVEATPKHLIIVDGAILQPIPEHPKRDFIFCLSTAFGDAYLFQAPCQVELENWVNSIHSACAAAFARHRGKTGTLHLLQEEIYRLEKGIESDQKLKHMAELQISVVADPSSKHQIQGQIGQWEENLERLQVEQFRLRCYMASLQSGELPNPKGVLTQISRPTKSTLNRLGVFTVSSLHAYICARSPSLLNNLLAGRGATKRRAPMLSRSNSASGRRSLQGSGMNIESDKHVQVTLPDHQLVTVFLRDAMTVEEFLAAGCIKKGLSPVEHFIRVKKRRDMPNLNYFVPHRSDLIETYLSTHEVVEVCGKILYQVELARNTLDIMWGFSVEAELVENSEKQDELCCYVSRVEERSVAMDNGIIKGDEIMVINGAIVSDLDMMYIESVLQEEMSLCMMMRSSRTEPPDLTTCVTKTTDDMIESLVCPPPPSDSALNEEAISSLIVPAPKWNKENVSPDGESTAPPSDRSDRSSGHMTSDRGSGIIQSERGSGHIHSSERDSGIGGITIGPISRNRGSNGHTGDMIIGNQPPLDVDALLRQQQARQAADGSLCRSPIENRKSSPTGSDGSAQSQQLTPSRQLTDAEKMRKVVIELVETERTYVKHLSYLMKTYLEPLKKETFLSNTEINALFGNIQEIYGFQQQFLQTLENALETEAQFYNLDSPSQFKNILFSIGSAFLYYVNHFKLYSSFCASHSKAQKVLHPSKGTNDEGNQALQEFLMSCNPKQQHSTALESYLIKPIQRILKYPLLLTQLKNLTDPNSDEHQHLIEALIGMEKVAEHINEMQRIHEEYGAIFDHLFRQHQKSSKQPIDLSPGDLLYYGGVEWLNISDFLGKIKKGLELHAMCFVFKTAVVFLCKERLRQKKKSIIGSSSKSSAAEVEIIRYQVLIPVTEVQVRASTVKDVDSHYLWELIHLKSQLQRRNEKVYHLSNSTSEFRNAFLKTIRQIIRESVRNMSLPPCDNLRKPEPPMRSESTKLTTASAGSPIGHTAQTLQLNRKKATGQKVNYNSLQRHSSGNIDYDNVENCTSNGNGEFGRGCRSRTLGDGLDELADLAINSESDSVRDEGSSGMRSEGEDDMERKMLPQNGRKPGQLGSTPNHLSLSTTSTLSSSSTTSQARLVQSSLRENNGPPAPPPRSTSSGDGGGNAPISCSADLGSPIWKPRDSGVGEFPQYREGGGGPRDPSEVRTRSRGAGDRPPSRSDQQRHTVGFESPHSNAKKETLQSACKRK
eukprot:TRINITY_DN7639_c0_g1_i2.p1 TRINITY_DN7639_c0_g1~~TRINITY_DN7639_c0_g1_i2.p1  ORF type:complete len:2132 (+),score=281.42 TRINITY_DN7639_c0_g1_i2:95-6490(+)